MFKRRRRAGRRYVVFLCVLTALVFSLSGSVLGQAKDDDDLAFWEELAFWEAIKDSENSAEFEAYLQVYPDGRFAPLARIRIQALTGQTSSSGQSSDGNTGSPPSTNTGTDASGADFFQDCDVCPQMVVIPAGSFIMGSEGGKRRDEQPAHQVNIAKPFALGRYEVSLGEWDACVGEGGCRYHPDPNGDPQLPVGNISWDDAQSYLRWLSDKTNAEYRLPSEAEWEYATRAGTATTYWWGDDPGTGRANCKDCGSAWSGKSPAPMGSFQANAFGLFDVHGNLWEWTADCWNGHYRGAPADGSAWTQGDCLARVLRGGAWSLKVNYMRSARRSKYDRDVRYRQNGLRVAKALP